MSLTLLTATGCRPHAWSICEQLMMRQDYAGPVRWVIVDDGEVAQPITFEREGWTLDVIRPTPYWKEGQNTQARNLLAGMEVIKQTERVVFIEDDDHYQADFLSVIDKELDRAELVGEAFARYYNVATRTGRQLQNARHASLCSTAIRDGAIRTFLKVCKPGVQFIDIELWKQHNDSKLFYGNRVTGIKGLPGRGGIGMGHKRDFSGTIDTDMSLLRSWIGDDVRLYG